LRAAHVVAADAQKRRPLAVLPAHLPAATWPQTGSQRGGRRPALAELRCARYLFLASVGWTTVTPPAARAAPH